MTCPQCGTGLGEGAKACATCGWSASRRTLWIVLGCVFGFLCLVCCGAGTVLYFKGKQFLVAIQEDATPVQLLLHRTQVVNFARVRGKPPKTLEEAATEPLIAKNGDKVEIRIQTDGMPIRFTMNEDRTFEVRNSGKNGTFGDADDLVEKGSLDEDFPALQGELERKAKAMMAKGARAIGIDAKQSGEEDAPAPKPTPPPPPGGGK